VPHPNRKLGSVKIHRLKAYSVHLYTASGVLLAFLAAAEIAAAEPSAARAILLLLAAVVIDSTDGPLARRWEVKRWAPAIDGRTIDDIVDYLTYTFLPLLLIWKMGWVPDPALLWLGPALLASLFGFANVAAKDEAEGFFLGFPSYWNVVAVYAGLWHFHYGPWPNAVVIVGLAILSVVPIRFVYPNLAPQPWRGAVVVAAIGWLALTVVMLRDYPASPQWMVWLSLASPAFYTAASYHLHRQTERRRAVA
jgi:phosphatidylcholine synthase